MHLLLALVFIAAGAVAPATAAAQSEAPTTEDSGDAALLATGEQLYERRCGACHSPDRSRIGPSHRGVVGRRAGAVAGYAYSPALKKLEIVWDENNLDVWLANPPAFAPGTKMGFSLPKADERLAIIRYLKSLELAGAE